MEKTKKPIYKKWWFWLIIIVAIIIVTASSQSSNTKTIEPSSTVTTKNDEKITLEEFNQIKTGMTYDEVVKIIGGEGVVLSESNIGNSEQYHTIIYKWEGKGSIGANANITIQGGKVISKAQAGLN